MIEFFKNLRISVKLIISAVVFVIAFTFVAVVAVTGIKRIYNSNVNKHNQQIFLNDAVHKLIGTTGMLSIEISSYATGTSDADVLKSKVAELKKLTEEVTTGSSANGIDDELKNEFRSLGIIANELFINSRNIGSQVVENVSQKENTASLMSSLKKFNAKFSEIMLLQNKLSTNDVNIIGGLQKQVVKRIIFWTSVLFFIAALLYAFTIRNIRISIQRTLKFTEELADGDLTSKRGVHTRDEIGIINESLEKLREKFKEVLNSLKDVSQSIEVASNEFRSGSEVISEGANNQAAASAEISSTIEEISAMLRQLSIDAKETDRIANIAYNGIQQGAESVDNALTTIEEIAAKNSAISEISYQTKILSINASVEAARAAEYGRGFAVVAEEVKDLAMESHESAEKIEDMIKNLQKESSRASDLMSHAHDQVEQGYEAVLQSLRLFGDIAVMLEQIARDVSDVAAASEEEAASVSEITTNIEHVASLIKETADNAVSSAAVSEETSAAVDQIRKVVEHVNSVVNSLQKEIDQFTI